MDIQIITNDGKARRGKITTEHGIIQTPFFMPIATSAAIKGVETDQMKEIGAQIVLSNTYHLHLRPGSDLIREAGGLHKFMNWDKPILTDSGGFQVFSLAKIRKITEEGVLFNSHIDGKEIMMTPEDSMQIQMNLGADIIMAFDECKAPDTKKAVEKSLELTTHWSQRSKYYVNKAQGKDQNLPTKDQQLFGIVQGSIYPDLRKKSAEQLLKIGFDGYAIGGLSVGEEEKIMYEMVDSTLPYLPESQPRYLMGVGTPVNIVETVARGVDMFDCVLPTRNARHGHLYTSKGIINIRNAKFKKDFTPLDQKCRCKTCQNYTKAYLRHLISAGEMLAIPLLVRHNVAYYMSLMQGIRDAIEQERFDEFRDKVHMNFKFQT